MIFTQYIRVYSLPCTKEIHVGWEIQRPFWLVLNWAFSDVKNKEIKLRKESLFIVSSDLQNFRSWNSKGISSVLSSRNLAARERAMHCILVKQSVLWLIPFPQVQCCQSQQSLLYTAYWYGWNSFLYTVQGWRLFYFMVLVSCLS